MKKQIFLSAIMLLGGIFTFNGLRAQNVGIGTNTPTEKLEVLGNLKADTAKMNSLQMVPGSGSGKLMVSDANGRGSWQTLPLSGLGTLGLYGYFLDTTDQTVTAANTPTAWKYGVTELSNGVHAGTGAQASRIYFDYPGKYRITFSAQIAKTTSPAEEVIMWLRKGGVDVTNSASHLEVQGNGTEFLPMVSFIVDVTNTGINGDYYELMFGSLDPTMSVVTRPAELWSPKAPSLILDVVGLGL